MSKINLVLLDLGNAKNRVYILCTVISIQIFGLFKVGAGLVANISWVSPNTSNWYLISYKLLYQLYRRNWNCRLSHIICLRELAWKVWIYFLESIVISYDILCTHGTSLSKAFSWSYSVLSNFLIKIIY